MKPKLLDPDKKLGLHIGCGPIHLPSTPEVKWINIDYEERHRADCTMDCCTALRFEWDRPISFVWSCHMLEHLEYPVKVGQFLWHCYDSLAPGGILRLAVPDLERVARGYVKGHDLKAIYSPLFKGFYAFDCPAERFLYFMREWQHSMVYDFDLLGLHLQAAGFTNFKPMKFNESAIPGFHYDRFESESLYVEALKP